MDAIAFLIAEHQRFRAAIHALEKHEERQPGPAFAVFATDLVVHAALEEEMLYPVLERIPELREGAKHAYHEHHLIDVQLDELAKLEPTSPAWHDTLHVLRESLVHHLDEEEEDVFPVVAKKMEAAELERLGEDFAEFRREQEKRLAEHPPVSAQAESETRLLKK